MMRVRLTLTSVLPVPPLPLATPIRTVSGLPVDVVLAGQPMLHLGQLGRKRRHLEMQIVPDDGGLGR